MISWAKTDFSDTVEIHCQGIYLDVSQTKHDTMQMKTYDFMPKVNTKPANCNVNFVSGPFSHWKNAHTLWNPFQYRISNFDVRVDVFRHLLKRSQVIILEDNVLVLNKAQSD